MGDKISFNIKKSSTFEALKQWEEATGKKRTAILNEILDGYFDIQKDGFKVGVEVKECARKILLLSLSEQPNVLAIRKEAQNLLCLISRS